MTEAALIDDPECLESLCLDSRHPPVPAARSLICTYAFPEQETKLRAGSEVRRADTGEPLGTIVSLDEAERRERIRSTKRLPEALSIGPSGPLDTEKLRAALLRVADSALAGDGRFAAVMAVLGKTPPSFKGRF